MNAAVCTEVRDDDRHPRYRGWTGQAPKTRVCSVSAVTAVRVIKDHHALTEKQPAAAFFPVPEIE